MTPTTKKSLLYGILVLLLSYFTYVHGYSSPPSLFWDENYHIASAQKYLNGTYFMEPHPPLGKLLIAWGEKIVDANSIDNSFIGTDYGKVLPPGFSFAGYRLFPTVLGALGALAFFFIFLILTRNRVISLLLTFPYLFDTALIVHSRSAMLDSTMLFFSLLTILAFLLVKESIGKQHRFALSSLLFGVSFALLMTTKVLGLILILLVPVLLWILSRPERGAERRVEGWKQWRRMFIFLALASASFAIVYISVWHMHFSIGSHVNPVLADNGHYQASEEYKQILAGGHNTSLAAFPIMLRDSLNFLPHYSRGVPRLDMCKPDENGSPTVLWPLGGRTIDYRWETAGADRYRYLYLVVNPVAWLVGLLGILLSASLLIAHWTLPLRQKLQQPFMIAVFLGLYVSYMIAINQLDRVMYLYHYFIPLLFSFILFGLAFMELRNFGKWRIEEHTRTLALLGIGVLIFFGYQWMKPFAYYEPISDDALARRNIVPSWELHCARCKRDSKMVIPKDCKS